MMIKFQCNQDINNSSGCRYTRMCTAILLLPKKNDDHIIWLFITLGIQITQWLQSESPKTNGDEEK